MVAKYKNDNSKLQYREFLLGKTSDIKTATEITVTCSDNCIMMGGYRRVSPFEFGGF